MDSGHKVSIIINDASKISFEIPDGVEVYLLNVSGLVKINKTLSNESVGALVAQKVQRSGYLKKTIGPKLTNILVFLKYLVFLIRFKLNYNKIRLSLSEISVDKFISLNMYNKLEYNFLMADISDFYWHIHNDAYDVFNRNNFFSIKHPRKLLELSKVVCISHEQLSRLSRFLRLGDFNSTVIYNPIDFNRIISSSDSFIPEYDDYLVIIASLTERKRVDRAIKAMSEITSPLKLLIIGAGPMVDGLKDLSVRLGLTSKVIFLGFINNPYPYIKHSKALLLVSDYEGLPTVIIEAMCLNVPVIATKCPTGPTEILGEKNKDFLIGIENEENCINDLSETINKLQSGSLVMDFSEVHRFDGTTTGKQWLECLNERF
jgi:glycosyltransferase involved in cell wall biosynthesis